MRAAKILTTSASLATLVTIGIAGCGGGGDDSTASTAATTETAPALSKAELISQGDAICAEVNAAVGSVGSAGTEASAQAAQVSALYIVMVESIERLGTPDDPSGYADFIAAAEELAKVEGEEKQAAEGEVGTEEIDTGTALEEFQTAAAVYGFGDCSEAPSAPVPSGAGSAPAEETEEGGVEAAPEEIEEPEVEAAPEELPETGGAGGGVEEAAPETGGGTGGGSSGGVGPG